MAAPLNGVWWTLPVELGFYLLLPLLGWLTGFLSWRMLLGSSLAVTMSWRLWVFLSADVENYLVVLPVLDSLVGTLFTFMLGFSLNFLPEFRTIKARRAGLIVGISFLLALMQWQLKMSDQYWVGHWILIVWPPMVAAALALIICQLDYPSPNLRWLSSPILVWFGHVSFGVYLWHFQVMRVLVILYPDYWGKPSTSVVALIITIFVTLVLASLSFYLIEKPLMGWGKKRFA